MMQQRQVNQQTMHHVPSLRFPEFKDEWEEKRLGEVLTFFSGGTLETI